MFVYISYCCYSVSFDISRETALFTCRFRDVGKRWFNVGTLVEHIGETIWVIVQLSAVPEGRRREMAFIFTDSQKTIVDQHGSITAGERDLLPLITTCFVANILVFTVMSITQIKTRFYDQITITNAQTDAVPDIDLPLLKESVSSSVSAERGVVAKRRRLEVLNDALSSYLEEKDLKPEEHVSTNHQTCTEFNRSTVIHKKCDSSCQTIQELKLNRGLQANVPVSQRTRGIQA